MTTATQDLGTYKPAKVTKTPLWFAAFESELKAHKWNDAKWTKKLDEAQKEVNAEQVQSGKDLDDFEKLLSAFHADTKDRMTKVLSMIKTLGEADPPETLPDQAKNYCDDLISDLDKPLTGFFKAAVALQGNRENPPSAADIDKAVKAGNNVPADKLKKLVKAYEINRKKQIDQSNATTNAYKNKVFTYRQRAADASKMIDKLTTTTTKRKNMKKDLDGKLREAASFFDQAVDGNFLKPHTTLSDLRKDLEVRGDKEFRENLETRGGKDRIAAYASAVTKQYNQWKIKEKQIVLLRSYCIKLDPKLKDAKRKVMYNKLIELSKKNKAEGTKYKDNLNDLVIRWKSTAAISTG